MILLFWTLAGVVAIVLIVDTLKPRGEGESSTPGMLSELDGEAAYRNIYAMEGGNDARILEEQELAEAAELAEAERIRAEGEAERIRRETQAAESPEGGALRSDSPELEPGLCSLPGVGDGMFPERNMPDAFAEEPDPALPPEPTGQDVGMIQAMIRAAERAAHADVSPPPVPEPTEEVEASSSDESTDAGVAEADREVGSEDLEDLFARLTAAGPIDLVADQGTHERPEEAPTTSDESAEDALAFMDEADADPLAFMDEADATADTTHVEMTAEIELDEPEPTLETEPLAPTLDLEPGSLFGPLTALEEQALRQMQRDAATSEPSPEDEADTEPTPADAATAAAQLAIDDALATLFADLVESELPAETAAQAAVDPELSEADTTEIPLAVIEERIARDELQRVTDAAADAAAAAEAEAEAEAEAAAALASSGSAPAAEPADAPRAAAAEEPAEVPEPTVATEPAGVAEPAVEPEPAVLAEPALAPEPALVSASAEPAPAAQPPAPRPRELGLDRDHQRVLIQEMFRRRLDERRTSVAS